MLGGITNSVSFRQGTNVEFEGPSFVEGGNGVPTKVGFSIPPYPYYPNCLSKDFFVIKIFLFREEKQIWPQLV